MAQICDLAYGHLANVGQDGFHLANTWLGGSTMNRNTVSRVFVAALFGLAALVGGGTSYASDVDDVKAAIDGYHTAISSLDLAKIDAVWAHNDTIIDKEPTDKTITVGWEGTRKNFEGLIAAAAEVSIAQAEVPHIQVQGDLAWSAGMAKADGKLKTGQHTSGVILEADVFKKQDGRWLLVSHVTSVMPE